MRFRDLLLVADLATTREKVIISGLVMAECAMLEVLKIRQGYDVSPVRDPMISVISLWSFFCLWVHVDSPMGIFMSMMRYLIWVSFLDLFRAFWPLIYLVYLFPHDARWIL